MSRHRFPSGGEPGAAAGDRPATYGEVLRVPEFRNLYLAQLGSGVGDQIAKIALAILVFERSRSPLLAALAYAAGYLPWLVGGPVLSPLADRLPRRRVMVVCDLLRALLIGLMALPGMPLPVLFALLLGASLLAPPFEAARAATIPDVLTGDRYVTGSSLTGITSQFVQVVGFAAGGAIVELVGPRGALGLDAVTFALSAVLLRYGVAARPVARRDARPTLVADTVEGAQVVFGDPVLRSIVLLAWLGAAFAIVPEGLAVTYADSKDAGDLATGLLTAASPAGTTLGALVVGRLVAPSRRLPLMLPLATWAMLPLLATALHPPVWLAFVLWLASGFGMAYQLPANAAFVAALPAETRGRAFGLAQSGLQLFQGLTIALAGLAARTLPVQYVVAGAGVAGLLGVGALLSGWPTERIAAGMAPAAAVPGPPVPHPGAGVAPDLVSDWAGPYVLQPRPRHLRLRLRALEGDRRTDREAG